jgi:16S rRNA (cytosine1402-N4)-methyltransferase
MPRRSPRGKPYHKPSNPNRPRGGPPRSTAPGEHQPVLLSEVLTVLSPQPGQVIVDCTLGYGGHSRAILEAIGPSGRLLAFDLDAENLPIARTRLAEVGNPFSVHHGNFAGLSAILAEAGFSGVDGLVADLGMSSMQLDDPRRGFSLLRDGPLDMRMDRSRGPTAAELLATLPEADLAQAFEEFGDEPAAAKIAAAIVQRRKTAPLQRTSELHRLIEQAAPVQILRGPGQPSERQQRLLPTIRVFQALRILVNRELASLQHLLRIIPNVLNPGGRAVLISFHSGEDRLIKAAFREGLRRGIYRAVAQDPLRPSPEERRRNPRSRSAKLRWAEKISQSATPWQFPPALENSQDSKYL